MNLVALAGFRYWNFNEHLKFTTSSPFIVNPDVYITRDRFTTENNFYSGQVGILGTYCFNSFYVNAKAKVALGAMCEEVKSHGIFLTNDFDGFTEVQAFPGGYFALPTNFGKHKHTKFAVIPEVDINIGYQITECLKFQVGYTFIYVSNVLWAGKQIDRRINPTQATSYTGTTNPILVGEPSPRQLKRSDSLWLQGVNAGFEFTF